MDGLQDQGRRLLQHRRGYAPVKHEVMVLVGGNPGHDLVGNLAVGLYPSVSMTDPGSQFLSRRVGKNLDRTRRVVAPTLGHSGHPFVLQQGWITVPGRQEVVADGN